MFPGAFVRAIFTLTAKAKHHGMLVILDEAGAGAWWSSRGTAGVAASEQRQERGSGTPGRSVVVWPV